MMTKINNKNSRFHWAHKIGFLIILALPILTTPYYFSPPDWGKSVVFRSIIALMVFLLAWQVLFRKNELKFLPIKKNAIFWALTALFAAYLLASIFSVDPLFSFWGSPYRGGGFVDFAFYIIFALLAFILFKKPFGSAQGEEDPSNPSGLSWKKALDFSIIIGVLVSLLAIIQYCGLFNTIFLSLTDRPYSTMGNPDILAVYLLLLFFIASIFAIKENIRWKKIYYICTVLLFLFVILITGSRGAYVGLLAGAIYFVLAYPKKIKTVKIAAIGFLILAAAIIFYVNFIHQYPKFLEQNKMATSFANRLSINLILQDARFYVWTNIDYKILLEKPLLGYGPENFAVGFDKYYNPLIPGVLGSDAEWWDRAHNIIIQTWSDAGIPGAILYLALFGIMLWQLQKVKSKNRDGGQYEESLMPHAIQATFIGYFVANLFGFDTFATYLIFFLLVGYSMHLTLQTNPEKKPAQEQEYKKPFWKSACISVLFIALIIFLWQYNLVPLQINAEINKATVLVGQKNCDLAFGTLDRTLPEQSFLDAYLRLQYVELERTCSALYPQNNLLYTQKGVALLNQAVEIQPDYTRSWLFLGDLTTTLAEQATDPATKNNLITQANSYFDRALQLAPLHQEILTGKAKIEIDAKNYANAQTYSQECVFANSAFADCYWYLGLSEIYLKDSADADKNIQTATAKGYSTGSEASLVELGNAYNSLQDYKDLAIVFEKLVAINPTAVQYHSSLAFIYKALGEYDNARQEAMKVLQLSPSLKQSVDAFLSTLP